MIGSTVSHYKILEKLGGGGMGVVYKAEDTKLKRTVALKFLPAAFSFDDDAKKRFINEAQAASALQHNNICTIHDINETEDGQIFICMDCYEGETLKKRIEREQIKLDEAIDIIVQVAAGLQKAHEKGIIHRDIKPANIFITNDGVVKILDFGLAKLSGQTMMTKMGETLGTIAYMSPEQTRSELVDQRTDIWSLGVVLYEMITKNLPFKGDYDSAMIYSILNDEPNQLTAIPKDLQHIIYKCLVKNPFDRYPSISVFLDDLYKSGIVKEGSRTGAFSFARNKKSRKLIYIVTGVIIVAVLAIAFWKFFTWGDAQSEKSRFIAVLPFHPITSSEEDKSFAEGIHDDILTQLSKIKDLRVIARTSVLQYRDTKKSIKQVANELGVRVILEGSTRRVGNTVRITAQLIDAETEEHIWADSYDRPYTDIFNIQSDVAQKIASALQIKLGKDELTSIETIPTENMQAWEYFQKGKYFWYVYNDYEGNLKSAEMFEKACELDTNFALAYAWQALVFLDVYFFSPSIKKDYYLKKYEKAIVKAALLAPEIPEINFARANYLFNINLDVNAAIKELELANVKRQNDVNFLTYLSEWENVRGNPEIALQYSKRVYDLDPKSPQGPFQAVKNAYHLDRFKQAERWAELLIANNPESSIGYAHKLRIYISAYGDLKRSETVLQEAKKVVTRQKITITLSEFVHCFYNRNYNEALKINESRTVREGRFFNKAILLRLLNRNEEAKVYFDSLRTECLEKLESLPKVDHYQMTISYQTMLLAVAYAGLGNKEKAFEQISKSDISSLSRNGLLVAYSYILLGKLAEAIHSLELSVREPSRYYLLLFPLDILPGTLKLDPVLDPLRDDPRFKKIIAVAEERFKKAEQ